MRTRRGAIVAQGPAMRAVEPIRIAELAKQVPGQWVALRDGAIIEVAVSLDQLMSALTVRGISDVTVMRSPVESEAELVGLG